MVVAPERPPPLRSPRHKPLPQGALAAATLGLAPLLESYPREDDYDDDNEEIAAAAEEEERGSSLRLSAFEEFVESNSFFFCFSFSTFSRPPVLLK